MNTPTTRKHHHARSAAERPSQTHGSASSLEHVSPPPEAFEKDHPRDNLRAILVALRDGRRSGVEQYVADVHPDTITGIITQLAHGDPHLLSTPPPRGSRALYFANALGLFAYIASRTTHGHLAMTKALPASIVAMLSRVSKDSGSEGTLLEIGENIGNAIAEYPSLGWIPTLQAIFKADFSPCMKNSLFEGLDRNRLPVGMESLILTPLAGDNPALTPKVLASTRRREIPNRHIPLSKLLAIDDPECLTAAFERLREEGPSIVKEHVVRLESITREHAGTVIQLQAFELLSLAADSNDLGFGLTHSNPFVRLQAHLSTGSSSRQCADATKEALESLASTEQVPSLIQTVLRRGLAASGTDARALYETRLLRDDLNFCCDVYLPVLATTTAMQHLVVLLNQRLEQASGYIPSTAAQKLLPFNNSWATAALNEKKSGPLPTLSVHFASLEEPLKAKLTEAIVIAGPTSEGYRTALGYLRTNKQLARLLSPWLKEVVSDNSINFEIRADAQGIVARCGGLVEFVENIPKLLYLKTRAQISLLLTRPSAPLRA